MLRVLLFLTSVAALPALGYAQGFEANVDGFSLLNTSTQAAAGDEFSAGNVGSLSNMVDNAAATVSVGEFSASTGSGGLSGILDGLGTTTSNEVAAAVGSQGFDRGSIPTGATISLEDTSILSRGAAAVIAKHTQQNATTSAGAAGGSSLVQSATQGVASGAQNLLQGVFNGGN